MVSPDMKKTKGALTDEVSLSVSRVIQMMSARALAVSQAPLKKAVWLGRVEDSLFSA